VVDLLAVVDLPVVVDLPEVVDPLLMGLPCRALPGCGVDPAVPPATVASRRSCRPRPAPSAP